MRILTFNMQAGIGSQSTRDMVFGAGRQLRDGPRKRENVKKIAEFIQDFDIVCLQEIGLGGKRSGGISQLPRLIKISGLAHSAVQTNRVVGKVSIHGNAILSRFPIRNAIDRKLPGRVQGRGQMICEIEDLTIINTHLSLSSKAQSQQLNFISADIKGRTSVVMCGDLNLRASSRILTGFAESSELKILTNIKTKSHPSWAPKRDLDHILISPNLNSNSPTVHDVKISDHLPVSVTLIRPRKKQA